jgi:hypothetical protein
MREIHCHGCGGFIGEPATVSYRLPLGGAPMASPHAMLCGCTPAIVYGPPPGWVTSGSNAARRN